MTQNYVKYASYGFDKRDFVYCLMFHRYVY